MKEVKTILEELQQGQISAEEAETQLRKIQRRESKDSGMFRGFLNGLPDICIGCGPRHTFEEEINLDYTGNDLELELQSKNGSLRLESWSEPRIQVTLTKQVRISDKEKAEELAAQAGVLALNGNRLTLKENHDLVSVSAIIHIPESVLCSGEVETSNGSIRLTDLKGGQLKLATSNGSVRLNQVSADKVSIKSVNGRIEVQGAVKDLEARTTNGSITMDNTSPSVLAQLTTVNGRIQTELHLDETTALRLKGNTTCGRIRLDLPASVNTNTQRFITGRRVEVERGDWDNAPRQADLDLKTVNGSIDISHTA